MFHEVKIYQIILSGIIFIQICMGLQCGIQNIKEENEQLQKVAVKCIKNYVSTFIIEKSDNSTNGTMLTILRKEDTEELEDQTFFAPARGLKRSKRTPQTSSPPQGTTTTFSTNPTIVITKGTNNGTKLSSSNTANTSSISVNGTLQGVTLNGITNGTLVNGTTIPSVPINGNVAKTQGQGKDRPIIDECTVKCFLQRMEMLNYKGYPDHTKMSAGFVDKFKGKELKDFVQDAMDECFFFMDKLEGDRLDACAYAGRLAVCLAEKARTNCEDWPVGNLPIPIPIS